LVSDDIVSVLTTINLYNQFLREAYKIAYVATDGLLAPELETHQTKFT